MEVSVGEQREVVRTLELSLVGRHESSYRVSGRCGEVLCVDHSQVNGEVSKNDRGEGVGWVG